MGHKANWKLPPYENTPEYWEKHAEWHKAYNTCAECGSTKIEVRNHNAMWGDGDIYCHNNHFVRYFDSG